LALIRVPTGVLPAPAVRELPLPIPLAAMIGPSVILTGLSIGSGELLLWPSLIAKFGFSLFWACWFGVTLQFFLNLEIERYSLATGESAVVGFVRLARSFGPIFFLCAAIPWAWPGWATGAAELVTWLIPLPLVPTAIAGLVLCGLVLSLGPVVYRTVEAAQLVMVGAIFAGLVALTVIVVQAETVWALVEGSFRFGTIPDGIEVPVLTGALAFAGAGGAVNLAQSNYIKDKGYGMGGHIGRITSPFTGREEAVSEIGVVFDETPENLARWRSWWRRSNAEHFVSFYFLCLLCMALFCLIAAQLRADGMELREGFAFLQGEAAELEARFGSFARVAFIVVGILVLVSTELALIDAVSRVAADSLYASLGAERVSVSRLYFAVVWGLIAFGTCVLLAGFTQPFWLIVTAACLNGFVMFLYSATLLWLNLRSFRGALRPSALRITALVASFFFYGTFSVQTLVDQLGR
jgi:hypothetical protein